MLNVVMLSVVMLTVMVPSKGGSLRQHTFNPCLRFISTEVRLRIKQVCFIKKEKNYCVFKNARHIAKSASEIGRVNEPI